MNKVYNAQKVFNAGPMNSRELFPQKVFNTGGTQHLTESYGRECGSLL